MEISVISTDRKFIQALSEWKSEDFIKSENIDFEIDDAIRIPGFSEIMYQIVADLGILTIPTSITTGLLTCWIWSGIKQLDTKETKAKITITTDKKETVIEISGVDEETLKDLLKEAINYDIDCQ
jgi:rRNA processing protein Krr1/Pno1